MASSLDYVLHNVCDVGRVMGMDRTLSEGQFEGMPEPYGYWRVRQAGEVLVGSGGG